jgi:hypothetical protein
MNTQVLTGDVGDEQQHCGGDDLDWLARNVHEWPIDGGNDGFFCAWNGSSGPSRIAKDDLTSSSKLEWYSKEEWLTRRAELQNKPTWDEAPDWAKFLVQNYKGAWYFFDEEPGRYPEHWNHIGRWAYSPSAGEVLGDWRKTLERRPEPECNRCEDDIAECDCDWCPNSPEIPDSSNHSEIPNSSDHIADANKKVGQKFDTDKPRFDLIPPRAEKLLAQVLTFGAQKYAPGNWQHVEDAEQRYIAAALRHINAQRSGEHSDPETGLPHLAHAMCCLAFVIELQEREFEGVELELALRDEVRNV